MYALENVILTELKVKGAIVLVAEKLAVSEPTIYRYLKKM